MSLTLLQAGNENLILIPSCGRRWLSQALIRRSVDFGVRIGKLRTNRSMRWGVAGSLPERAALEITATKMEVNGSETLSERDAHDRLTR